MSEIGDFIGELGAGTFEEKVHATLKEAGYSAMKTNASSEIVIKLKITPASQSQAKVEHTISTDMPTLNGKKKEINKTHTLMYVDEKGGRGRYAGSECGSIEPQFLTIWIAVELLAQQLPERSAAVLARQLFCCYLVPPLLRFG